MSYMFSECAFLKKIDLSKFDTSEVVDMSRMFYECYELIKYFFVLHRASMIHATGATATQSMKKVW